MGRLVAALAHGMEDVGNLPRQHLLSRKPPKQIMGGLARRRIIDTGEGRDLLDHVFAELPALDQRRVGVFSKEALGERAQAMQLRTDFLQMTEICRQFPTRMLLMTLGRNMPQVAEAGKLELWRSADEKGPINLRKLFPVASN